MRKRSILSAAALVLCSTQLLAQGTWTTKAAFGGGVRSSAVAFSIGHKGYIGLGATTNSLAQDLWEYDPLTNAWTQKAVFIGSARSKAVAFVVNGKAYVGTGTETGNVFKKDFFQYDPATNAWTVKASLGGAERNRAVAFAVDGFGFVALGGNATTLFTDVWRYDPNQNQWTQRANFGGGARADAVSFVVSGSAFVGTGVSGTNTPVYKKDLWKYNRATDNWAPQADFGGVERDQALAFTIGNFGYIATGAAAINVNQQDAWRYDPGTNTWTQVANVPQASRRGAAFSIAGKAYAGTGLTTTAVSSFREYDPGSTQAPANSWTRKANRAAFFAFSFSIGNKGYIGGGGINPPFTKSFFEYDPASNVWSQKADLGQVGTNSGVGFNIGSKGYLATGQTIIQGQFGDQVITTRGLQEYDPAANTWSSKPLLPGSPRRRGVGFSIGTKGYVGTGNNGSTLLKDFWEYDQLTNAWTQKADVGGPARDAAAGFSIGGKGYIGTGVDQNGTLKKDFWEYDPVNNTWTAKPDFGGAARQSASGFSIGAKGYIGIGSTTGNSAAFSDFWEFDPVTNSWTQRSDFGGGINFAGSGFSIGNKGYLGAPNGQFWEYEPGPVNCSANQVVLTLNTDRFSQETSWEISASGNPTIVCNGNGYAGNSTIAINCCLPNGCYDLRVFDSFGDGILSPGGYDLRDASNQRIVDNNGNGGFTALSQVTNGDNTPWSFCVPLGTDALVPSSCDQVFSLGSTVTIQVQENPAVTGLVDSSPPLTTGYQICIFDPNGGFRRNVFQSFGQPGAAFPAGTPIALKPTFFNLNFSQGPFLPVNKLLNVRVRAKLEGVFLNCGPACRLVVGTPPCTTTKLTTTASPQISCGAQNVSVNGGQLFCDLVPGANRYRFQFQGPNNFLRNVPGPAAAVNSLASRTLTLAVFQQQPLPCGVPLTVRVQASFDGGTTFCPFGPDCSISVTGCPVQLRSVEDDASTTGLTIWPNPSDGGRLNIRLDGIAADLATVELADAYGKLVRRETLTGTGSGINTVLDLGGDIAEGLYFVTITAGGETFTDRVMITR